MKRRERETKSNTLQSDLESLMTLQSETPHTGQGVGERQIKEHKEKSQ